MRSKFHLMRERSPDIKDYMCIKLIYSESSSQDYYHTVLDPEISCSTSSSCLGQVEWHPGQQKDAQRKLLSPGVLKSLEGWVFQWVSSMIGNRLEFCAIDTTHFKWLCYQWFRYILYMWNASTCPWDTSNSEVAKQDRRSTPLQQEVSTVTSDYGAENKRQNHKV